MDLSISKLERLPNGKVMGIAKLYVLYDSLDDECNTKDENLYIEFTFERKNGELNFSEFDINDQSMNFYKAFTSLLLKGSNGVLLHSANSLEQQSSTPSYTAYTDPPRAATQSSGSVSPPPRKFWPVSDNS